MEKKGSKMKLNIQKQEWKGFQKWIIQTEDMKATCQIEFYDDSDEAALIGLYIDKKYRNKGMGTEFIGKVIDIVQDENFKTLYLFISKDAHYQGDVERLLKWYYKLGFKYYQTEVKEEGNLIWLVKSLHQSEGDWNDEVVNQIT